MSLSSGIRVTQSYIVDFLFHFPLVGQIEEFKKQIAACDAKYESTKVGELLHLVIVIQT